MPTLAFTADLADKAGIIRIPDVDCILDVDVVGRDLDREIRVTAVYLDGFRKEHGRFIEETPADILSTSDGLWLRVAFAIRDQAERCPDLRERALEEHDEHLAGEAADMRRELAREGAE
jgi:hypothetical protein